MSLGVASVHALPPLGGQVCVHILMATHNGGRFIQEQLNSIQAQTHANWVLHVSDDASSDDTLKQVADFAQKTGRVVNVMPGPQEGSTQNFIHLIHRVGLAQGVKPEDLFAFADQDDVWFADKLERAVAFHQAKRETSSKALNRPLLYASAVEVTDEDLHPLYKGTQAGRASGVENVGVSARANAGVRIFEFSASLVQNQVAGNTLVMNKALIDLYQHIQPHHAVWHDWTAFQIALGCGGEVHWDERATLSYRQHERNVIGVKSGLGRQGARALEIMQGRYRSWIELILLGMQDIWVHLDASAQEVCQDLQRIHSSRNPCLRFAWAYRSKLRRQGRLAQVGFVLACTLGWV